MRSTSRADVRGSCSEEGPVAQGCDRTRHCARNMPPWHCISAAHLARRRFLVRCSCATAKQHGGSFKHFSLFKKFILATCLDGRGRRNRGNATPAATPSGLVDGTLDRRTERYLWRDALTLYHLACALTRAHARAYTHDASGKSRRQRRLSPSRLCANGCRH